MQIHRLLYAEYLPWVIKRYEYVGRRPDSEFYIWDYIGWLVERPPDSGSYIWDYIGWPPNRGERRDIPSNALFHRSVIDRMKLPPDPDPKKFRTKHYVPDNFLWVQDSSTTPHHVKRNLSELAHRSSTKDCDRGSETQALVKPKPDLPDLKFVLADDLTKGSVAIEGESVDVGAKERDGIYRVVLDFP